MPLSGPDRLEAEGARDYALMLAMLRFGLCVTLPAHLLRTAEFAKPLSPRMAHLLVAE